MKKMILIVDDDPDILEVMETFLEDVFDVILVDDPRQVLNQMEKNSVNLVITDLVMPHISGSDLAKKIKGIYPAMPVIAFSWLLDHDSIDLEALGVDKYIEKPFHPSGFLSDIRSVLGD